MTDKSVAHDIFIHIPKSAGTTFHTIAYKNYSNATIIKYKPKEGGSLQQEIGKTDKDLLIRLPGNFEDGFNTLSQISALSVTDLTRIRYLGGHMSYGIHRYLPGSPRYITFFRNPIKRVLSDFKANLKPGRLYYNFLEKNDKSLIIYLDMLKKLNLDNIQTRLIAGNLGLFKYENSEQINNQMLELAKANLKKHFIFGFTECFDESLLRIYTPLDWRKLFYISRNLAESDLSLDELGSNEVQAIKEFVYYDQKLYDYAKEEFHSNGFFNRSANKIITRVFLFLNSLYSLKRISTKRKYADTKE